MQSSSRVFSIVVLTLVPSVFAAFTANAADSSALKGKRVVVIRDKAPFYVTGGTSGTAAECSVFTVDYVKGTWLWVKAQKAYLKTSDVVPFDEAIGYYTRRLETDRSAANYERRGKIWRLKGELDLALGDLNEAIRLNPNLSRLYGDRGLMLHNKGQYEKAVADFTDAIRLSPRNGTCYHNRARSLRELKEYDKALADFDEALRLLDPKAMVSVMADTDVAGADSSQMINSLSLSYFVRGYTWLAKGDFQKALADYDEALRRDPKHETVRVFRRRLWNQLGAWDKIIADCEATLASDPDDASALVTLARLRATCPDEKFRNGQQAVEGAKKASDLRKGKSAEFLDTLAAAYAESGDFDQAIEYEQQAISIARANVIADFEARLKLYRGRQPYRQPVAEK